MLSPTLNTNAAPEKCNQSIFSDNYFARLILEGRSHLKTIFKNEIFFVSGTLIKPEQVKAYR
jgi:hypothetical protein